MNTKKQRKTGFTLVELMVVAIIVAILAAVAIPLMNGNKKRAVSTEAEAAMGSVVTTLRVYLAEHGTYPTTTAKTAVSTLTGISATDFDGQYFDTDDFTYISNGTTYTIYCVGDATSGRGADEVKGTAKGIIISLDHNGKWGRLYR